MTDTNALLPCPFCGERAETYFIPERHSYQIECSNAFGCTARVTQDSEPAAIEAWNLRSPSSASQPVAVPAGMEPVARIEGIDEYGPRLEWTQHWVDVGVGAKLYTASQVQAMPESRAPSLGTMYFTPSLTDEMLYDAMTWNDDSYDKMYLKRKLVHLNSDAAMSHAKVLISLHGEP